MKKKLSALILAFVSVLALCALTACGNGGVKEVTIDEQKCYVFTASSSVMELTENTSVADYLGALKEKEELTYEGYTGNYGFFINSVNGVENQIVESTEHSYKGYSWYVYIDFIQLEGDSAYYATDQFVCNYQGKTLYRASVGVSFVPCVKGHTYALVYAYEEMSF